MSRANSLLLVGGLVFALAGCHSKRASSGDAGVPDAGIAHLREHEPNDTLDQAMVVSTPSDISAALAVAPEHGARSTDEDWYRLEAAEGREADLHVSGVPGAKIQLELFDAGHDRLAQVGAVEDGQPVELLRVGLHAPIWVRVSSATKGAGGSYTLAVLFHPVQPGWEMEPNDRAADATLVPFEAVSPGAWTARGLVAHTEDEDWYRIVLSDGGSEAQADDAGSAPTATAPVMPAPLPVPTTPTAPPSATPSAPPVGGSQVASLPPDGGADAGGAEVSPLQAIANASSSAAAEKAADAGWGFAPPPPKVPLRIELSAVSGVTPKVTVLTAAEAQLFSAQGKEGEGLLLRNVGVRATDRVIYVVVASAWTGKGSKAHRGFNAVQPYTLTVSREPAGAEAELEPNESPADATELPLEGFRDGYVSPEGDVDTYVLRCPTPTLTDLRLSGVDRLDLELQVLRSPPDGGAPERVLRANDGDVKEPEYLNAVGCRGEVYVQVQSALRKVDGKWRRPYENSQAPYRLTAKSRPDTGAEEREPNDDAPDATAISLGQVLRGTLQPKRDEDDFRLDLSHRLVKTSLQAAVTGVLGLHIGLYLYRLEPDGKLSLVQTADRARDLRPEIIRYGAAPAVYILQVRDVHHRAANFQDAYQLSVREGG